MKKKINIAVVGLGNIGSYFYKTLSKNDFEWLEKEIISFEQKLN